MKKVVWLSLLALSLLVLYQGCQDSTKSQGAGSGDGGGTGQSSDGSSRDDSDVQTGSRSCSAVNVQLERSPNSTPFPSSDTCSQKPCVVWTDVTKASGIDYVQMRRPNGFDPNVSLADCLPTKHVDKFASLGLELDIYCGVSAVTGGAAVGDYDGDGWPDLFVTRFDDHDLLYRNRGDGTFEDRTAEAGLTVDAITNGAAWGDVDNDGDLDLYVTTLASEEFYLFINDGAGRFTEQGVERNAAVAGPLHMGNSVTFGDYNRDGWLDIFVTTYGSPSPEGQEQGVMDSRLLKNRGPAAPGYFEDVTDAVGVELPRSPVNDLVAGFAPTFVDLDQDGWLDLAVTADFGTSQLFWNQRDGTFVNGTETARIGTALNEMGSTFGDYDGDGDLDWFVSAIHPRNFGSVVFDCSKQGCGNRLYRNEGNRLFLDQTDSAGLRDAYWGWGTSFFDADNDGDLDVAATNGMDIYGTNGTIDDPMVYWENDGTGKYRELSKQVGITDTRSGKALLAWDYDRDGDLDLFITNTADQPILYRNDSQTDNDWLQVKLQGSTTNAFGLGARISVQVRKGGPVQIRQMGVGAHYLGHEEYIAHFGLGSSSEQPIHQIKIWWPGSDRETNMTDCIARNQRIIVGEP